MDPTQPIEGKERLPEPLRLHCGADPLQSAQQQLGQLASSDWIGERGIRDQDTGDLQTNICSYKQSLEVKRPEKDLRSC